MAPRSSRESGDIGIGSGEASKSHKTVLYGASDVWEDGLASLEF